MGQFGQMGVSVFRGKEEVPLLPGIMKEQDFFFAAGRPAHAGALTYALDVTRHFFAQMKPSDILKDQYIVSLLPGQERQESLAGAFDYEDAIGNISFSLGIFKGEPHLINQGEVVTPIPLGKSDATYKLLAADPVEIAAFSAVLDNFFGSATVLEITRIMYAKDPFLRREEWKLSQDIRNWIHKEETRRAGSPWHFMMQYIYMDDIPHQVVRLTGNNPLPWCK